jgi:1-acyl-sn-glycerol-3-phosphate acyltransferase
VQFHDRKSRCALRSLELTFDCKVESWFVGKTWNNRGIEQKMNLQTITAIGRAAALSAWTIVVVSPAVVRAAFVRNNLSFALRVRKRWARCTMKLLGVSVRSKGALPCQGPCLYVGNHRSYFDPIVVLKDLEVLPVAKAEMSSWPLIGFAARATGIMFVKRESRESRSNTLQSMENCLREGYSVLVYPEGTTHMEPGTIRFNTGAFRLAAALEIPMVPIAIEYHEEADAWVGNDTFVPHFLRTFGRKKTAVDISYGPAFRSGDSAELLSQVKTWVDAEMERMRADINDRKKLHPC